MFNNPSLSKIRISITALDSCAEALERQKCMLRNAKFRAGRLTHHVADTSEPDSCIRAVKNEGPFDLVFMANCLTEMPVQNGLDFVERLPEIMADNGAIIIAEAQRDYTKALVRSLAAKGPEWGLNVYYPCPEDGCPYSTPYCWAWRYHQYEVPIITVNGRELREIPKAELVASWIILTKQDVSIYDSFRRGRPDLGWGPISGARLNNEYRWVCSGNRRFDLKDDGLFSEYRRGHVVGLSDENEVKQHYKI